MSRAVEVEGDPVAEMVSSPSGSENSSESWSESGEPGDSSESISTGAAACDLHSDSSVEEDASRALPDILCSIMCSVELETFGVHVAKLAWPRCEL